MKNVKGITGWALRVLSAYMIFKGFIIFINTSGSVQGSEFGMLITLSSQLSLVMMWLALFSLNTVLPEATKPVVQQGE
jgi:hypothetical protein